MPLRRCATASERSSRSARRTPSPTCSAFPSRIPVLAFPRRSPVSSSSRSSPQNPAAWVLVSQSPGASSSRMAASSRLLETRPAGRRSPSRCRRFPRRPMSNVDVVVHIVDDEETVRNSLAFLLTTSGYAARAHTSATEFLKIAPAIRNGCLITDLRMPDMSGVELLRGLRQAGAMLPAIVITGHGDVQMAVEAMKNGALDFIEKPFSDDVLLESIKRVVELASTRVRNEAVLEATR